MIAVATGHVVVDADGVAWIDDTNVKVIEVVLDKVAHGATAEEMHVQYPHLSVAQIYSALAYYHDHQAELDARIARDHADIICAQQSAGETPGRAKLRAMGLRP